MAAGKAGPLSGVGLKRDQEAHLHQRMKKPGAVSRAASRVYPACAPHKKTISGKPEIGAQIVSLYFPNSPVRDSCQSLIAES